MGPDILLFLIMGGLFGVVIGLLGIGGGIVMIPLLLFLPPALGAPGLDMKVVTALTVTTGLAGSCSGAYFYFRQGIVSKNLLRDVGSSLFTGALVGGVLSKVVSNTFMLGLFGTVALVAGVLILLPTGKIEGEGESVAYHRFTAAAVGLGVGLFAGILGVGGGPILISLLIAVLHIPTRVAIASSLPLVFIALLAGFLGKLSTFQIPFFLSLVLVCGVIPGTKIGSVLNRMVDERVLRGILAVVVIASGIKVWWEVAHRFWI